MVWYWVLWEILVNMVETTLFTYFLYARLGVRPNRKKAMLTASVLYVVIVSLENFAGLPSRITMPIGFLYWLLFAIFLCEGSLAMRILWGSITTIVVVFVNYLLVQLSATLPSISVQEAFTQSSVRLVMTILYLILETVCYMLLLRLRVEDIALPRALSVFLIALMLVAVVAVALLTHLVVLMQGDRLEQIIALITAAALFVLTVGTSVTMNQAGEYLRQNQRMRMEIEVNHMEKDHASRMLSTMNTIREWRHDLHDHLELMLFFHEKGEDEKLRAYMREMGSRIDSITKFISTGNATMDAILSSKQMQASQWNIAINAACAVPDGLPLSDLELCVMVGNLLDNAIEASVNAQGDGNEIDLRMRQEGGMFYVRVENPSSGQYLYDDQQRLKSIKAEGGHGIGLDHIRRMAEQVQGFLTVDALETKFIVNLVMPLQEGGS